MPDDARYRSARRRLLKGSMASLAGLAAAPAALAKPAARTLERTLAFHNLHTGEDLKVAYWTDGDYVGDALAEVNHHLRDHRTGEVHPIDPALLDLLYGLKCKVDARRPFYVISGYRSPRTNRRLRASSNGVAKYSLHMDGKAIDIRVPGCGLRALRRAAMAMKAGGVGYYPSSGFIHVDVGRVRYW